MLGLAFASLAAVSGALMAWQWLAAARFPLGTRLPVSGDAAFPAVTILKAVKGADAVTAEALATWTAQRYRGDLEVIFGVDSPDDGALPMLQRLVAEAPAGRARVVVCPERLGVNRKVSNLIQMVRGARGGVVVLSDADVAADPDLVEQMTLALGDPAIGLVHCLYRFADAPTLANRWEALAVNADFWSQVLQNQTLHPLDYALGAAVALRRADLQSIGGFESLADFLADDNRLGRLVVDLGKRTELSPLVVDCRVAGAGWGEVWRHQLRWAVTIRVCQGPAYFLSILANGTLWPLLWAAVVPGRWSALGAGGLLLFRAVQALALEARLTGRGFDWGRIWLVPVKDLLQVALWLGAFVQRRVVWGGIRYRVLGDGRLRAE